MVLNIPQNRRFCQEGLRERIGLPDSTDMRIRDSLHLTYCLNVHPGETWEDQFRAIRDHAEPIARRVAGGHPFGLGLRLSADSAAHLASHPADLARLRDYLADHNLYALTVNAFPYGRFHGVPVKDGVYRPSWAQPERLAYTLDVARVLSALLPEGVTGSLSTAPLTFKGWPDWERDVPAALAMFAEAGRRLAALAADTGRHLVLAMEPEPFCYPETTPELCDVFARIPPEIRSLRTLGCCFDTAHQAVEFEDLARGLASLQAREIPVGKIQLSSAMAGSGDAAAREQLRAFCDPVYLHQACVRSAGGIRRTADLLPLVEDERVWQSGDEIRVHYHVPLFTDRFGAMGSTSHLLAEPAFAAQATSGVTSTLEIETYTWKVWQDATGDALPVDDGIVREIEWVRRLLP